MMTALPSNCHFLDKPLGQPTPEHLQKENTSLSLRVLLTRATPAKQKCEITN